MNASEQGPETARSGELAPSEDSALYRAILARRSVRRYDPTPLTEEALGQVRALLAEVVPLAPENRCQLRLFDVSSGSDLVRALGGYGRVVNPPHYILPYGSGERLLLADLGFRAEQVAVRLAALGLGSCFIGCLGREEAVRAHFSLPAEARAAAFLVFGRPSAAAGARAFNAAMRASTGATRKLPAERIFFSDTFAHPATPPDDLAPLIEAARRAPSAVDAQPWRFLWHDGRLHLFVKRRNPRYGLGATREYNLHDGGVCMANVSLALAALGRAGRWLLYDGTEATAPEHPAGLAPLARLVLA